MSDEMQENVLRRAWKRLRGGYHDVRGTIPFTVIEYWNGECPVCGEHVGIDIKENQLNRTKTARCAECDSEIYRLIKEATKVYQEEQARIHFTE